MHQRRDYMKFLAGSATVWLAGCTTEQRSPSPTTTNGDVAEAQFEFTYDRATKTLEIRYLGGGRVVAGNLEIRSSSGTRQFWHQVGSTTHGSTDALSSGATARIGESTANWGEPVTGSQVIRLVYTENESAVTVGRFDVPERTTTYTPTTVVDIPTDTPTQTPTEITPTPFHGRIYSTIQKEKVSADLGDRYARFGADVAIDEDGSTALITALHEEDPNGSTASDSGAAYIFTKSGETWAQEAKLSADDGDSGDDFGFSGDIDDAGETVVISAHRDEDPNGESSGSVYVFSESDDAWTQDDKITPDDGDDSDLFGKSVVMSQDGATILATAPEDEGSQNGEESTGVGSAYVFEDVESGWEQQAKLTSDDGDSDDVFGQDVAVADTGQTAIVSASQDEDPNGETQGGEGAGSAYVFSNTDGTWEQESKLSASDGEAGDRFGVAVDIADGGTTAIVGTAPTGSNTGDVYVFEKESDAWSETDTFTGDDVDAADGFAAELTLSDDGSLALVGAASDEDPNGDLAGSAYLFSRYGSWEQRAKLTADDGDANDKFGFGLDISDHTAVIGAYNDEDGNGTDTGTGAGSAYIFDISVGIA